MKLISCHIENFGKLHDFSMNFMDGTNIICEQNGWGKSTFAAFIRAMFYGLGGERKKSIEENERKRYTPWQGGVFGGQLTFETNGKMYTIIRVFAENDIDDGFELREANTNLRSTDFSENIGEEIFKINRESFLRTIFIGQMDCATNMTEDINTKIGHLTDNTNDINSYEAANQKLTDLLNSMTPRRATGSMALRKTEIEECEKAVNDGKEIADSIGTIQGLLQKEQDNYESLKQQSVAMLEMQQKVTKFQKVLAQKDEWDRLKQKAAEKQEDADVIKRLFPGKVPDIEEINAAIAAYSEVSQQKERMSSNDFTDEEAEKFQLLDQLFATNCPTDEALSEKFQEATRFNELKQEINAGKITEEEERRLAQLEPRFANREDDISDMVAKWNNRMSKQSSLSSKQAAVTALKASMISQNSKGGSNTAVLIVGVICVVGGIGACVMNILTAGIPLAIVGVVLFALGFLKGGNKNTNQVPISDADIENMQNSINEDKDYISNIDNEIKIYLGRHGKGFDELSNTAALQEITKESFEYTNLKQKSEAVADTSKIEALESLENSLQSFINVYVETSGQYTEDLYLIKENVAAYRTLAEKKKKYDEAVQGTQDVADGIESFLYSHGFEVGNSIDKQLTELRDAVGKYNHALDNAKEAANTLAQFEKDANIVAVMDMHLPSMEEVNDHIQKISESMEISRNAIVDYNKKVDELHNQYDEWEVACSKLERLKADQEEEKKKFQYLAFVQSKLADAKETITSKYSDPIFKNFSKYYSAITNTSADDFHLDSEANITVDECGEPRELGVLSTGSRDLIGICLRIALVDAMYQDESPVLILDDPFTNLDDEKMASAKKFLDEIGRKYQILYFTCSDSRKPVSAKTVAVSTSAE